MEIIKKPIDSLIPYAKNARVHDETQIAQIAGSIKEFGFNNPVLIDKDNGIIAGHGRVMAARKLGLTEVPTILLDHLNETQRKAYILADNRIAINSTWDNEMLSLELMDIKDDVSLAMLGFNVDELDALLNPTELTEGLTDEDAVPDVPNEPTTKLGDIYQLGNHRLMCGDSTSIDAVDKLMDGKKADMVFTDPPYGMFLNADFSDMGGKNSMTKKSGNKYEQVIGDHNDFTPELINTVFACFDYCKEIFMWGADYYAELLPKKNEGSWVVWDKRGDESADKMYGSTFELCWSKARHKRMMARVKWAGIFGMSKEHDKKRVHPTQKPVELITWFFDYFSLKDKTNVVDLYGGSGSTLLASEKVGKHAFVMELDPKYCDVIIKRWEDFTGKKAVLL